MTSREKRQLKAENTRHDNQIGRLANSRLRRMILEFRRRYPRHRLEIRFGNGTDLIEIDERYTLDDINGNLTPRLSHRNPDLKGGDLNHRNTPGLGFILEAIDDVITITDGYQRGCPDDVKLERRKVRGRART